MPGAGVGAGLDPDADAFVDPTTKGFPAVDRPIRLGAVGSQTWRLADLPLPVMVLRESALAHNLRLMSAFCREHGVELMPHGKTTMAPQLWRRQLEAGATGIAAADTVQARVMAAAGVPMILIANEVTDEAGLRWIADELRDPAASLMCCVDSADGVRLAAAALRGAPRPLPVLVELGHPGGRAGCRTIDEALMVAELVLVTPELVLAGASGYEGTICQDRGRECLAAVRTYVEDLAALCRELATRRAIETADTIVSAGGSSFFDVVAEVLAEERVTDRIVLRSGCYVTHDAAHYERLSPFASLDAPSRFRSAIEVWGAVLSRPEPELAIVGVGRRDVPFDQGPPTPLFARSATGDLELGDRMVVERLNDQHAFCRIEPALPLAPGDRVAFGISHPCTAFDKWRVIPVLADDDRVVDAVATYF